MPVLSLRSGSRSLEDHLGRDCWHTNVQEIVQANKERCKVCSRTTFDSMVSCEDLSTSKGVVYDGADFVGKTLENTITAEMDLVRTSTTVHSLGR